MVPIPAVVRPARRALPASGMVASASVLATDIDVEVLRKGGNAVGAARGA